EPSRSANVSLLTWSTRAARSAARFTRLSTFTSKLRMLGGNATPPPVNWGARVVPARARPVPFWRHGFARPPETRPRDLAARGPACSGFNSARPGSWTRCGFPSAAKTDSSSSTLRVDLPVVSRSGALVATVASVLPDLEQPALRPRHGALDEKQV